MSEQLKLSWPQFLQWVKKTTNRKIVQSMPLPLCNSMSRDLGLNKSKFESENEISEFIQFIEEEFHLVMITEYLEASLVLLADLMSWPLHYVASIGKRVRSDTARNNISDEDRRTLLRLNHADHRLYEHFLAIFRRRVLEYGFERMAADVQRLNAFNIALDKRCVSARVYKGHANTGVYRAKAASGRECKYLTELKAWRMLKEEQVSRLALIKRLQSLIASTEASSLD